MATEAPNVSNFRDILLGFERTLHLETLAELGRKPNLVSVEVVACFADIRGFTRLVQDDQERGKRVAAEFLREFFAIFPKAVLREAWDLEPDDPQQEVRYFQKRVWERIIPRLAKKLGDGVVLVWELDGTETQIDRGVRYAILDIVGYIQEYFYTLLKQTGRDKQKEFSLDLGIGLAAGPAWRHDYVLGGQTDYSGAPMNLAARLQDQARPNGVCVDADYECLYLLERMWAEEGQITDVKVSGLKEPVFVWLCKDEPLKLRKPRKLQTGALEELRDLVKEPYIKRPKHGSDEAGKRALSSADLRTLLELREDKEASFARAAAERKSPHAATLLDPLIQEMKDLISSSDADAGQRFRDTGQKFHEAIGFLSADDQAKAQEHSDIVCSLHKCTTRKNYPQVSTDLKEMCDEHIEIAEAIKDGKPQQAEEKMHDHLEKHHSRVRAEAFRPNSTKG